MAKLSSETLFTFMDDLEHLLDTLKNGFLCRYHKEFLPGNRNYYFAPMRCFCDIPLSMISDHLVWYGNYGLGIRRFSARQAGAKPIWYITSDVKFDELLKNEVNKFKIVPYLKKFMGNQYNKKQDKKMRKKFYDEREWRFIPKNSKIYINEIDNSEEYRMNFDIDDIEYIIINNSKDFSRLIGFLHKNYKVNELQVLLSKVLTSRQILKDF